MAKKNIGSSFDDFLKEEAMLEEVTAVAMKRVISWQIAQEMKAQQLTKTRYTALPHLKCTFGSNQVHHSRSTLTRLALAV
jgi:hypothetical protein